MKKDPTSESRKDDHISMAIKSQVLQDMLDGRFYYEPILAGHPSEKMDISIDFLGYQLDTPVWISSMTGGTEQAIHINKNLAKACGEFGMGMGLGSCRSLLESDERLEEFAVKKYMPDQPLYSNIGIAQVEELLTSNRSHLIIDLIHKLDADGLIIHINPLQEWLQPEGDKYNNTPIDTIRLLIDKHTDIKIIVKEVGQGMGPKSLEALYKLPIQAVDFAAAGGTNFSKLELSRSSEEAIDNYRDIERIGHSAEEMVEMVNRLFSLKNPDLNCHETIVSGGVKNFLDGYYLTEKMKGKAIYGQASSFLIPAINGYESLQSHIKSQIEGLKMAHQFLSIK